MSVCKRCGLPYSACLCQIKPENLGGEKNKIFRFNIDILGMYERFKNWKKEKSNVKDSNKV